jgi:mannose-6-phosphate isomerase-like protein (cupin superfamily)
VRHKTVEEIWYFVQGEGQVWRKYGATAQVTDVRAGTALKIPYQAHFQFRNTGKKDLVFLIVTMPAWPGPEEAIEVKDEWPVTRRPR